MPRETPPHINLFSWWMGKPLDPKVKEYYKNLQKPKADTPKADNTGKEKKTVKKAKTGKGAMEGKNYPPAAKNKHANAKAAELPTLTNVGNFSPTDDALLRKWKEANATKPWAGCDEVLGKPKGACKTRWAELRKAEAATEAKNGVAGKGAENKGGKKDGKHGNTQGGGPGQHAGQGQNVMKGEQQGQNAWADLRKPGYYDFPNGKDNTIGMRSQIDPGPGFGNAQIPWIQPPWMQQPQQQAGHDHGHNRHSRDKHGDKKRGRDQELTFNDLVALRQIAIADQREMCLRIASRFFDETGRSVSQWEVAEALAGAGGMNGRR